MSLSEPPDEAIEQAIEALTRDRSRLSLAAANREIYLRDKGVASKLLSIDKAMPLR